METEATQIPPPPTCQNCDAALTGPYCAQCGQRDLDFRRDWRGLLGEVLSSFFNFEGKVPHGIVTLLFRPGVLTGDFLKGHRMSQIPPLRFYLFVSVLFFLWQGLTSDLGMQNAGLDLGDGLEAGFTSEEAEAMPDWVRDRLRNPQTIAERFREWLPTAFLLGVPLLALFTRVLFLRKPFVYLEHLVLALHTQTFVMLWLVTTDGWSRLVGLVWAGGGELLGTLLTAWIWIYPVFAIRYLFKSSWKGAIGSALLLEFAYLMLLGAGLAAVGALAFFLA